MSLITHEYLIAKILEDSLEWVKSNPYFVDLALTTHRQDLISSIKQILIDGKVKVMMEFGWQKPSFPAYVIFIQNEEESHQVLNDLYEAEVPITNVGTNKIENEVLNFTRFPQFQLQHFPLTTVKIYKNGNEIPSTDFNINYYKGSGILLGLYSPDDTYTVDYVYFSKYQEKKGSMMSSEISIDTISDNINECLLLHRFLIYLLMSMRSFLSDFNLKNQYITSDSLSVYELEEQPIPLYSRRLNLHFDVDEYGIIPWSVITKIEIQHL